MPGQAPIRSRAAPQSSAPLVVVPTFASVTPSVSGSANHDSGNATAARTPMSVSVLVEPRRMGSGPASIVATREAAEQRAVAAEQRAAVAEKRATEAEQKALDAPAAPQVLAAQQRALRAETRAMAAEARVAVAVREGALLAEAQQAR